MGPFGLVMGGGGIWGMAWLNGVLAGLFDRGFDARNADHVVGTSAGSVVGAQLLSGLSYEELFARQIDPAKQPTEITIPAEVFETAEKLTAELDQIADHEAKIARLCEMAVGVKTISEQEQRNIAVKSRLPSTVWPTTRLSISALDTETFKTVMFNKDSGVELVDTVAASCAVPKIWPPVTIQGRKYIDGGIRSLQHAPTVAASKRVLVISPYSRHSPPFAGPKLADEIAQLEARGCKIAVIEADSAAVAAAGDNTLAVGTRVPAALAGRAQGREAASLVLSALLG